MVQNGLLLRHLIIHCPTILYEPGCECVSGTSEQANGRASLVLFASIRLTVNSHHFFVGLISTSVETKMTTIFHGCMSDKGWGKCTFVEELVGRIRIPYGDRTMCKSQQILTWHRSAQEQANCVITTRACYSGLRGVLLIRSKAGLKHCTFLNESR